VKRVMNALGRLFRVNRGRASAPDSTRTPFIRIVKDRPCPNCGTKFPNRPKVHDEKAGGGDATRRIA
jgi:rubredoxin